MLAAAFCAVASFSLAPMAMANDYGIYPRDQSLEEISKQFNETSNGYQERHSAPLYTADGDIDLGVLGIDTSRSGAPDLRIRDGRPEIEFSNTRRHGPNAESERIFSIGVRDGKPSFRYMYELRF
jgi:hypothetical protein